MKEYEKDTLLNQYLNGGLRGKALQLFFKKLKSDEKLTKKAVAAKKIKERYKNQLATIKMLQEIQINNPLKPSFEKIVDFEKMAQKIEKEEFEQNTTSVFSKKWLMPFFIGVVFLSGVLFLFLSQNGRLQQQGTQLLNGLEKETPYPPLERVIESSVFADLEKGHQAYEQKNYEVAIDFYKKSLEENPDDDVTKFYVGLSYWYLNQKELAKQEFEVLEEEEFLFHKDAVLYYLNLLQLKTDNNSKEIHAIFKKLSKISTDIFIKEKAKEIVKILDQTT